ncbi:MAG: type III secretion inner membrane ring lipoprotein SctJ [Desulfobacteraceae bacterium]
MKREKMFFRWTMICMVLSTLLVIGCDEVLYSNLQEKEINQMMAILLRKGIACQKMPGQEESWNLKVEAGEMARAIEILMVNGYPKEAFVSIGDVFKKEGLVSSPLEERIRFIHALSQEVSDTISRIDGILSCKVHVVLPKNDPLAEKLVPSSASVFIKHKVGADLDSQILKIKELVVNSIEGLDYKKVSLALFPSKMDVPKDETLNFVRLYGIKVAPTSVSMLRRQMAIIVALLGGLTSALLYFILKSKGKLSNISASTITGSWKRIPFLKSK